MEYNEYVDVFKEDTLIVLDTNIILALFRCSSTTSKNILSILNRCKSNLWIPHQVYNEYNKHKDHEKAKLEKKYETFKKELEKLVGNSQQEIKKCINESKKLEYPNCKDLELDIEKKILELKSIVDSYYNSTGTERNVNVKAMQISEVENFVDDLVTNNQIGKPIEFNEMISIIKEGELRFKYKIPPGYEDEKTKKGIEKYGDLFLWKEIINHPQIEDLTNVIFVTNDGKEDWWILKGEEKKRIKIRDELKYEFNSTNKNCHIYLLDLVDFHTLSAQYYEIKSIHSDLELNSEMHIKNNILKRLDNDIYDEMISYVYGLNFSDFDDEFYRCNDNDISGYDPELKSFDFEIDDDYAIYRMTFEMSVGVGLAYKDNEGDSFPMGNVDLTIESIVEVSQKISESDTESEESEIIEFTYMNHKDAFVVSPYDLYAEADGEAEMDDAIEEFYKH